MYRVVILLSLLLAHLLVCEAAHNNTLSTTLRSDRALCPAVKKCIAMLDKGESCDLLPVPRKAQLNLVASGYRITKGRDGVWFFEDLFYSSMILFKGSRLAVLDFPESANEDGLPLVVDAVKEIVGDSLIRRIDMVYSHAHYDHIGGASKFFDWAKEEYPSARFFKWGTFETRRMIKASKTKRAPVPNVIVRSKGRTLSLGDGLEVQMKIIGGHTIQDLELYIPPAMGMPGILMFIDVVFPRWVPFKNLGITDNARRAVEVHREFLQKDFEFFIGGHLGIGTKGDVKESSRFYTDLVAAAEAGSVVSDEEIGGSGFGKLFDPSSVASGNAWLAINTIRNLQVAKCKRIMIEKWGCRLGGFDVFIDSHCFTAVTYVVLEV